MDYSKRTSKLQKKLRRKEIDGLLIARPENRRYLCGYCGGDHGIGETSGLLLVPARGVPVLVTDFRFELQAKQESSGIEILVYTKDLGKTLMELAAEKNLAKLAFEADYTLYSFAKALTQEAQEKKISLFGLSGLVEKMRVVKDEDEISLLQDSVQKNEEVFTEIFTSLPDYRTELDLAMAIETLMRQKGAESPSFPTIVASGANGALPHAVPGRTPIKNKASLTIDMGLVLGGYCSDMTRNFAVGKATKKYLKIHRIVRQAQQAGLKKIRAGVSCCEVDQAARKVIEDAGYGKYFGHSLGHGVGLAVHEEPRLSRLNRKKLKAGMVVTVEPGIYLPGWGGVRLENMVVVRDGGYQQLNCDTTWLDI